MSLIDSKILYFFEGLCFREFSSWFLPLRSFFVLLTLRCTRCDTKVGKKTLRGAYKPRLRSSEFGSQNLGDHNSELSPHTRPSRGGKKFIQPRPQGNGMLLVRGVGGGLPESWARASRTTLAWSVRAAPCAVRGPAISSVQQDKSHAHITLA